MTPAPIKQSPRPPLLLFVSCLALLVLLTGFLGYAALRNGDAFNATVRSLQQGWSERLSMMALPNQAEARSAADADNQYLLQLNGQYRKLHRLLALSVTGLGLLVLIAFFIYRYALVMPLRTLTQSCRDLAKDNLRGVLWGIDRTDHYGELARAISDLRKEIAQLSDMVVESPDGTSLVRFSGRGGAVFNTLIGDLQAHIRGLQENGEALRHRLEGEADVWARKVQALEDSVMKNSAHLHDAIELSREQMQKLNEDNQNMRIDTKELVDKFRTDLETIGEITAATGQRVAQTLSTLRDSDRDVRQATQQTLKSSESFSKHAADLTEKLVAATTLMRASGKIMMETTEAARTRFLEAVQSLETQDQTLRAFLSNTADKTEQIAGLYDSLSGSTQRVHETVDRFDARMGEFSSKSDAVLAGIAASGAAMNETSASLKVSHDTMAVSLESMRGHTDVMAKILTTIRDEYTSAMDSWRGMMNEATPAIAQLKDAGDNIQSQLKEEWSQYAKQSHALLVALEQDARAMNARTEQITSDTEKLMANINSHSEHLSQSAGQFDLQVANLTQRIEAAAASVMRSNDAVASSTTAQIGEIHTSVSDMVQRLGILTQLTGTLGGVAGQLGALVPALGEMQNMPRAAGSPAPSGASPAMVARMEQMSAEFGNTLRGMRNEFDTVRTQISRWVETLSNGYQRLAQQISGIDGVLEAKLSSLKLPAASINSSEIAAKLAPSLQLIHETLADEAGYNMKMGENVEVLRNDLAILREQVLGSSDNLRSVSELLAQGFSRLLKHDGQPGTGPVLDLSRMENASAALENLIASMQGTSFSLIEKLERVTQELDKAVTKINPDQKAG